MLDKHMASLPGGEDTLVFATPSGTPVRHGLLYRRRFKPAVYAAFPAELQGLRFHDPPAYVRVALDLEGRAPAAREAAARALVDRDHDGPLRPPVPVRGAGAMRGPRRGLRGVLLTGGERPEADAALSAY